MGENKFANLFTLIIIRIDLIKDTPDHASFLVLVPPLRDLYYRECRDGLYSTATFILTYAIHVLPFHIIASFFFSIIVYW